MLEFNATLGQGPDGRIQLAGTAALVLSQRAAEAQKKFVVNVQQAVQETEEAAKAETREEQEQARIDREARQKAAAADAEVAKDDQSSIEIKIPTEEAQENIDIVV